MKTRTIAGDIRRIRSLMRLGPDIGSCVIRRADYVELLKLFDAIETKAKRMQEALKPVLECPASREYTSIEQASHCMNAVADAIQIYCGGAE